MGASYLVFGALLFVRAMTSSLVIVDDSGVRTRSIVRTHRYDFSELRGVDVGVGRTGLAGFGREYLVLHLVDRPDVAFKELNCAPPHGERTSIVREAAASIRERLARA
jgi:hypothetical protein